MSIKDEASDLKRILTLYLQKMYDESSIDYDEACDLIKELKKDNPPEDPTDSLLKIFINIESISEVVAGIRKHYKFGVHSDESCVNTLTSLRQELSLKGETDLDRFDELIKFINSDEGTEMPDEIDLIAKYFGKFNNFKSRSLLLDCQSYITDLIDC